MISGKDVHKGTIFYWSSVSKKPMYILDINNRSKVKILNLYTLKKEKTVTFQSLIKEINKQRGKIISKNEASYFIKKRKIQMLKMITFSEKALKLQKRALKKYNEKSLDFLNK